MKPHVVQIAKDEITRFVSILEKDDRLKQIPTTNEYEIYRGKGENGLIIVYSSGKAVINGEQGKEVVGDVIRKIEMPSADIDVIVGSDEAGKGEWLGPLVTAAVAILPSKIARLRLEGIMDSKTLSLDRIRELAKMVEHESVFYHVVTISPKRFNSFFKEVKEEGKSLNDILAWSHYRVLSDAYKFLISEGLGRMRVVIDEFDRMKTENRLSSFLKKKNVIVEQKTGAEEEIPVAAASIIARSTREKWIDAESKSMGVDLRSMTKEEVLEFPDAKKVAKLSYINRRTETDN
jgi:ribonuclease HIII